MHNISTAIYNLSIYIAQVNIRAFNRLGMTKKNQQILKLWTQGKTCRALAKQFGFHLSRIYQIVGEHKTPEMKIKRTLNQIRASREGQEILERALLEPSLNKLE